ncbi:MAG: DUF1922 domain-containing protein [Promethearchaeota archaeon]
MYSHYKIIRCNKCGLPQYVKEGQKTRKCPNCNKTINLRKVIVLERTNDLKSAVLLVQKLKMDNKDADTFTTAYDKEQEKF